MREKNDRRVYHDYIDLPEIKSIINKCDNHLIGNLRGPMIKEIISVNLIEGFLIQKFLRECNKLMLHIPAIQVHRSLDVYDIQSYFKENLKEIINSFETRHIQRTFPFKENILHSNIINIPCYALARHHGIPTRWLDWTIDPLIAAFFAAEGNPNDSSNTTELCVWILENSQYNLEDPSIRFHDNIIRNGLEYLIRQKGLFTEMLEYDHLCCEKNKWLTLDEYLMIRAHGQYSLKKVILPPCVSVVVASIELPLGVNRR